MATNSNNKNVKSTVIIGGNTVSKDIKPDAGNTAPEVGLARPHTPGECVMIGGTPVLIQSSSRK